LRVGRPHHDVARHLSQCDFVLKGGVAETREVVERIVTRMVNANSRPFASASLGSPVAQSVERRTVNPLVVGSSPTLGAKIQVKTAS
jgi:hypothetical protein